MKTKLLLYILLVLALVTIASAVIIIQDYNPPSNTYNVNITSEVNMCHLSINDSSMVLYMPFDVNTSVAYDYTNYSNDGTISGANWTSSGKYGGAYEFNGSDNIQNIQVPYSNDFNITSSQGGTWMAWVKTRNNKKASQWAISTRDSATPNSGFILGVTSAKAYGGVYTTAWKTSNVVAINNNTWYHLAGTWNTTDFVLYVNGTGQTPVSATADVVIQNTPLSIGRYESGSYTLNGTIDEVMIWNRTLSAEEINATYKNQLSRFYPSGLQSVLNFNITEGHNLINVTLPTFVNNQTSNIEFRLGHWNMSYGYDETEEGLVSYYEMDNRDGNLTGALDSSGNNNGTISGANWTSSGKYGGAYEFDGVNDYITANPIGNFTYNGFTYAVWFNAKSYAGKTAAAPDYDQNMIFDSRGPGISTELNSMSIKSSNGKLTGWYQWDATVPAGDRAIVYGNIILLNTWTFGAMTANVINATSVNLTLYQNGVPVSSGITTGYPRNMNHFTLGKYDLPTLNAYFNGTIDEVMLWNRTLSADEIKKLYIEGRPNWQYTDYQDVTTKPLTFEFPLYTTHLLPQFRYTSGTTAPFYTSSLGDGSINQDLNFTVRVDYNDLDNPYVNISQSFYIIDEQGSITISFNASDENLNYIKWNITKEGILLNNGTTNHTIIYSNYNISLGTYTLNLYAKDNVGHINLTHSTFEVNTYNDPSRSIGGGGGEGITTTITFLNQTNETGLKIIPPKARETNQYWSQIKTEFNNMPLITKFILSLSLLGTFGLLGFKKPEEATTNA